MSIYTLPHPALDSRPDLRSITVDGRDGLPNSVREALLGLGQGEAALLIDALLYCGLTAGKRLTIKTVLIKLRDFGLTIAEGLIRRALNSGIFKAVALQNGRRGRPEMQYTMPHIMALVKRYANNKFSATDPLDAPDMPDLTHYRQALHREFIRRAPGIYSRKFLAQRLGVGQRTTRNYDRRVGIIAIPRLSHRNLKHYLNWQDIILAGKPGLNWLCIHFEDGRYFDAPLIPGIAQRFMWKKGVLGVYLITQLCNRYILTTLEDLADYQFLRLHDDERFFATLPDRFGVRQERIPTDPVSATLMVDPKAYKPASDPIPDWLPPELAARRISTNPFLPRHNPPKG